MPDLLKWIEIDKHTHIKEKILNDELLTLEEFIWLKDHDPELYEEYMRRWGPKGENIINRKRNA